MRNFGSETFEIHVYKGIIVRWGIKIIIMYGLNNDQITSIYWSDNQINKRNHILSQNMTMPWIRLLGFSFEG